MRNIAELLGKISAVVFQGEEKKKLVAGVVKKITSSDISATGVKFSGNTIFIETEPIIKSQIFLRKDEIIEEINKLLKTKYSNLN